MRPSGRSLNEIRSVSIETHITKHSEGSCLIKCGETHVICTATIDEKVPPFLRNSGLGWVTAEYSMLPGSTPDRADREAAKGKQGGRTIEIQRLIGRSLRSCCDMTLLGERQVIVDCDVLQADGGTRTASICGAYIALHDALTRVQQNGLINKHPLHSLCAAVSVGIHNGVPILDLPYVEDSSAEVDMNVVMLQEHGSSEAKFVEVQGTAEGAAFSQSQLTELLALATNGLREVFALQTQILSVPPTPRPK